MALKKINQLLSEGNEMKVLTETGELLDLKPNLKVDKATIIIIDMKENLYEYLFGKKRINEKDVVEMVETFEKVKQFIFNNSSYAMKKKVKNILK